MNKLQIRQLKVLEDTVAFYGADVSRRGLNEKGDCIYITPDKKKRCAIGRLLPLKVCESFRGRGYGGLDCSIFSKVPKNLSKLRLKFLQDVQDLHDRQLHWSAKSKTGLTNKGTMKFNTIKKKIKTGYYEQYS